MRADTPGEITRLSSPPNVPMPGVATEVLIIILLLALNGVFAMSELAIVTARKVRLEQRAEAGDAGAKTALALAHDPTQFLSTVQVGITLIGVLAGAFGGATISDELAAALEGVPAIARYADAVALGIVVTSITYLSLLIGELIPKRVALGHPERVASLVARPMKVLARAAAPVVVLLTGPTNLVLRLFGIRVSSEPSITVAEIRALVEQGAESGVVEEAEHEMVMEVFRLGDRYASDVMTPRTQLEWIDVAEASEAVRQQVARQGRAHFLVGDGSVDNVLGVVHAEDLLVQCLTSQPFDVRVLLQQPFYVPATLPALDLLERFKKAPREVAVVLDEYGGLLGVVMFDDLAATVVGEIDSVAGQESRGIVRRDERTWVIRGTVSIEDVEAALDLPDIPPDERRSVRTLGGFIMMLLGRLPKQGEHIEWDGLRLEVATMEGRRVKLVVVTKLTTAVPAQQDDTQS
ncbi:MAG: hemolysin family protein [Gemmatimonadaceae bacterium]